MAALSATSLEAIILLSHYKNLKTPGESLGPNDMVQHAWGQIHGQIWAHWVGSGTQVALWQELGVQDQASVWLDWVHKPIQRTNPMRDPARKPNYATHLAHRTRSLCATSIQ